MDKHPQKRSTAPGSDAVWARPATRHHTVRFTLLAVLFGSLAGFSVYMLVVGEFVDSATQTVGVALLTVGAVVAVAAILAMATLPRRTHNLPAIAVDADGVWWVHHRQAMLTAWRDLAGVGTSYKVSLSGGTAACPYAFAFEAYVPEATLADHPHQTVLRRWLVTEEAPDPSLPRQRLRFLLPAADSRHQLHRTVGHYAPQLWVGEHERRWGGTAGT